MTAIPLKDVDDVAPAANETLYGHAAGIWTGDLTKAHRLGWLAGRNVHG